MKRILVASALALMLGSTAQAQGGSGSDHSGPGGAGAGVGGLSGSFVPLLRSSGGRTFAGSTGQAVRALSQVIRGNPTVMSSLLTTGGVSSATASALSQSLASLHGSGGWTLANLVIAVNAYNAAVNSLAPGAPIPMALLLARSHLAAVSRQMAS